MELIPAPARQFQTWSMWLLIAGGVTDLVVMVLTTMDTIPGLDVSVLAAAHVALALAIGVSRFVKQLVTLTTQQKVELIQAAAEQPVHAADRDVTVALKLVPPAT